MYMDSPQKRLFTFIITVVSLAIALPGLFDENQGRLILTLSIFFLGRLLECVNSLDLNVYLVDKAMTSVEALAGTVGIGICMYCLTVYLSTDSINTDVIKYPLLGNVSIIFIMALVYVTTDLIKCGIAFYKSYITHRVVFQLVNQKHNVKKGERK